MYIEPILVIFIFFFVLFIVGQILHDNSIVDIGWGAGFVLTALYTFLKNPDVGIKGSFITLAVVVWGIRLTYHIGKRNIGKPEDFRYVNMRKSWGTSFVFAKSFLQVYFLQFFLQAIVSLVVIYGNSTKIQEITAINVVGIFLWGIGFFFESYGDYELKRFKKDPANKGKLMDKGLWSLTRHPNYFGDATMWFGIFFLAISNIQDIWIIISPVVMTFLLVFVSGVRMLEKKYVGRQDYDEYKKRTSMFIPWFPRKK